MLFYNPYNFDKNSSLTIDFSIGYDSTSMPSYEHDVNSVACSSDGTKIIIALEQVIMISEDSAVTWKTVLPNNQFEPWSTVACDSDFSNLIVASNSGRIYISNDSGDTWSESRPNGNQDLDWHCVASDGDGSTLLACIYGGRLYKSTNSGSSWAEVQPDGDSDYNFDKIKVSSNGLIIAISVYGGRLYKSTNGGSSWTELQPEGDADKNWGGISISDDGTLILAGVYNGRGYISTNSGSTWTEVQPDGDFDRYWLDSEIKSDGSLIMTRVGGGIFNSTDSGESWSETGVSGTGYSNDFAISDNSVVYGASSTYFQKSTNGESSFAGIKPAKFSFIYYIDDEMAGCFSTSAEEIIDDIYKITLTSSETNADKILIKNAVSETQTYNSLIIYSEKSGYTDWKDKVKKYAKLAFLK